MKHLDVQLQALDEILSKVRDQNTNHHDAHIGSLTGLANSVKQSYSSIGEHLADSSIRAQTFESDFTTQASSIVHSLVPLEQDIYVPLSELRENVLAAPLVEYSPTGQTPQKSQYQYQSTLPRTQSHTELLRSYRGEPNHIHTSTTPITRPHSPSKTAIYTDRDVENSPNKQSSRPQSAHSFLRELDINIVSASLKTDAALKSGADVKTIQGNGAQPPFKRQNTGFGESANITLIHAIVLTRKQLRSRPVIKRSRTSVPRLVTSCPKDRKLPRAAKIFHSALALGQEVDSCEVGNHDSMRPRSDSR